MIILIAFILIFFIIAMALAWIWYVQNEKSMFEFFYQTGLKALQKKQYHKAEESFLRALKINSGFKEARYELAMVYIKIKDYDKAKEQLEILLKAVPKHFDGLFNMGYILQKQDLYEEAKEFYLKALKESPNDCNCIMALGEIFFLQQNYNEAQKLFEQAKSICPEKIDSDFYIIRCMDELCTYENLAEGKEIIGLYLEHEEKNILHLPENFNICLAKAYAKNGQLEDSFLRCQKSLDVNTDDAEVYKYLALMQLIKKDLVGAKSSLSVALNLKSNDVESQNLLSYLLCQQKTKCALRRCREKYQEIVNKYFK